MAGPMMFTAAHLASVRSRGAELERSASGGTDTYALVRATRLYTIATRIADEIGGRGLARFTRGDLARIREELRELAIDAANPASAEGDAAEARAAVTRAFREIALRIEERLFIDGTRTS